jgi:hypothetical protein
VSTQLVTPNLISTGYSVVWLQGLHIYPVTDSAERSRQDRPQHPTRGTEVRPDLGPELPGVLQKPPLG